MTRSDFEVLTSDPDASANVYRRDPLLSGLLRAQLDPACFDWLEPQLDALGARILGEVEAASAVVDKHTPVLRVRDRWGRQLDAIDHHPAYRRLEAIGYGSGAIAHKYDPALRQRFGGQLQTAGFALSYLFAQSEAGVSCPMCMTDGVARVLERHGTAEQRATWIPRLAARELSTLARGAMFLTEKQGGSDVGRNATRAVQGADGVWRLWGDKWFCSNVDGEAALVLARPEGARGGTSGLGLFLLTNDQPGVPRPGTRVVRLKDKLGVRSMASGEVVFEGAPVQQVGPLDAGFKMMAEMLNLSRLWNAVCSMGIVRRAVYESTEYLRRRVTFGRPAIEHGLVREQLADLQALSVAGTVAVVELSRLLDRADAGDAESAALVRVLTPLAKYHTARWSVQAASEAIELHGGNGYIEESPLPRLLRDAQVLPVWEGTTNILVLDTLRACQRGDTQEMLLHWITETCHRAVGQQALLAGVVDELMARVRGLWEIVSAEGPDGAPRALRGWSDALWQASVASMLLDRASIPGPAGELSLAALRHLLHRWSDLDDWSTREDREVLVEKSISPA